MSENTKLFRMGRKLWGLWHTVKQNGLVYTCHYVRTYRKIKQKGLAGLGQDNYKKWYRHHAFAGEQMPGITMVPITEYGKPVDTDWTVVYDPSVSFVCSSPVLSSEYDAFYSDSDQLDDTGHHINPYFKPDWSPELLHSVNYTGSVLWLKKELYESLSPTSMYDLALQVSEKTNAIGHIPHVLYSDTAAVSSPITALQAHFDRLEMPVSIEPLPWGHHVKYPLETTPLVSIIIPTKDHPEDLNKCVQSILDKSTYANYEILLVENNSTDPATFENYKRLCQDTRIRLVTYEKPFNFSDLNNWAVQHAKGDLYLFLNNDTEMIAPDSIAEMVSLMLLPGMGAVGAKLIYPNHQIQHAGVIIGNKDEYAEHCYAGTPENQESLNHRIELVSNFSAVTGACLLTSKTVFEEAGGFDVTFANAANDIDLCLSIRKTGRRICMTPFSYWYHYETLTRGFDMDNDNNQRYLAEVARFNTKWPMAKSGQDPYHNPNYDWRTKPFFIPPK